MSIGPTPLAAAAAGASLAQIKGSDIDRAAHADAAQSRQAASSDKAEKAAGIGTTEEDQEVEDRDADGRRLWEAEAESSPQEEQASPEEGQAGQPHQSKDPTGQRGNQIDLSG